MAAGIVLQHVSRAERKRDLYLTRLQVVTTLSSFVGQALLPVQVMLGDAHADRQECLSY